MIQMANTRTHSVPGYDTDENEVYLDSFGQWGAASTPSPLPVSRYSEGTTMLKFTDQHGTSVEMFVAGTSLFVRYWKSGAPGEPVKLSDDVSPNSDLLPIEAFGLTVVHAPSKSQPGKIIECVPGPYGYYARVV